MLLNLMMVVKMLVPRESPLNRSGLELFARPACTVHVHVALSLATST